MSKRYGPSIPVVVGLKPENFEEMSKSVQAELENSIAVVLNLTSMDHEQTQRTMDFVADIVATIDGYQQLQENVVLLTPHCED